MHHNGFIVMVIHDGNRTFFNSNISSTENGTGMEIGTRPVGNGTGMVGNGTEELQYLAHFLNFKIQCLVSPKDAT